jgi:tRNA nucleotidyltransferase (CCA-adding enzyme)
MNYKFDNALDDITKTDRSSRRNNYLIDELEEITRENLELKKEFISKLD